MKFVKTALSVLNCSNAYRRRIILGKNIINKKLYTTTSKYNFELKVNNISLNNYVENLEKEYEQLCQMDKYSGNKRWIELNPLIQILKERQKLVENIANIKELLQDADHEMRKLAIEEQNEFENQITQVNEKLLQAILPVNKEDSWNSVVLEVQAGIGGQEAMLFAKEVFDMYCKFAEYKGWELQIADYLTTDLGGVRHATALIDGNSVFQYFKHEAGVHRVQRTPTTEKAGRIHTSTISVVALPQPPDIEVRIHPRDLKIETKRSTGAGGQHVNTTDSAVRIVHLPTGIAVECQVDRSQIKNKKMAMARLSALLYQKELDSQNAEIDMTRKNQVRTKNRNEKIRTYNFNQDRITDHRLQGANIHNLQVFLQGGEHLEKLIKKLDELDRIENLLQIVHSHK